MVYSDSSPVEVDIVHSRKCLIGLILAGKANKSEATTAIGVPIFHDNGLFDISIFGEAFSQSFVGGVPR